MTKCVQSAVMAAAEASPGVATVNTDVIVRTQWADNSAITCSAAPRRSATWQPWHWPRRAAHQLTRCGVARHGAASCDTQAVSQHLFTAIILQPYLLIITALELSKRIWIWMWAFWPNFIDRITKQKVSIQLIHNSRSCTLNSPVISVFIVTIAIEIATNLWEQTIRMLSNLRKINWVVRR